MPDFLDGDGSGRGWGPVVVMGHARNCQRQIGNGRGRKRGGGTGGLSHCH